MIDKDDPIGTATKMANALDAAQYKIKASWADVGLQFRMLWPLTTPLEKIKLIAATAWTYLLVFFDMCVGVFWIAAGRANLAIQIWAIKQSHYNDPIGIELATDVVTRLQSDAAKNKSLNYGTTTVAHHKYYCGQGLFYGWGKPVFTLSESEDGYPSKTLMTFRSSEDLIAWLAQQSDLSLCGVTKPLRDWRNAGNQRINRFRLHAYLLDPYA